MSLSKLAVKRPVATGTILLLVLLIGLVSLYQSPLDLLPDIQPPVLAVITVFPGSSPQETLELVTRPVEEGVSAVSGLTNLISRSQENTSLVIMQFDWGINVKDIREDVNVRMDLLDLPDEVQRPMILEFDPTLMPIMTASASGTDNLVDLTEWLEDTAAPRLESVLGVASVTIQGGAQQDLFIRTAPEQMEQYELSFDQIANVLRASLLDLPAGIIDLEDRQVRIRFLGRQTDQNMLSDLVVGFQVDQERLEEMIGAEIDVDLNQLMAGENNIFDGGFAGFGDGAFEFPRYEVYWDDFFDFDGTYLSGSSFYLPIAAQRLEEDRDIKDSMRPFTSSPHISFDETRQELALSMDSLGSSVLNDNSGDLELSSAEAVRLNDVWLIERAVLDSDRIIVPLDPVAMERLNISALEVTALAEEKPLVTDSGSNYLVLSFHEDWENIRRNPIISVPDLGSFLDDFEADLNASLEEASSALEDASSALEELLVDFATSSIVGSMSPGGSPFGDFDFDEDFPIDTITLGMVAEIARDTYAPDSIARFNQQPSISLSIQKEGDANTVLVANRVRDALDQLTEESKGEFSQVDFNITLDQGEEVERALADLAEALLGGAVLAIIVLIVFLRNWRTTMFIGISIPAAIIATFTLLYFTNMTINLMTLGGLALAAGMLVDNAIVVSENIFRHYQMGKTPADAAVHGAEEVAGAITASTLTTISVFFPVVFLSGLAGQLFWEFALVVACAILASLVVALTVIPLLASRSLHRSKKDRIAKNGVTNRLHIYRRVLRIAVRHPWWVLIFVAILVGIAGLGFTTLGTELFPGTEESAFTIDTSLAPGTAMSITDQYAEEIEKILENRDEVASYTVQIGSGGFMRMPGGGGGGATNRAQVRAEIEPAHVGQIGQIIEEVRKEVQELDWDAEVNVNRESLLDAAGLETTLDLTVSGRDLDIVTDLTGQVVGILEQNPEFSDIQSSLEASRPEVQIRLDQSEALQKGVTQAQVAGAVRQALEGIPVSRIETDVGILSIILGYEKSNIETVDDLGNIGFYTPGGEFIRLGDVATLTEDFGPQSIPRENQRIVGEVQMQYGDLDLGTATEMALADLADIALPDGYEIKPSGSFNLMGDVLDELQLVVIMAALLVYLVMAAQFESLLHPFIIILSLPMAYAGSIAALMITGNNISVPAMIGVVVLSGILVNDGIIMIDYINQQRRIHGLPLQEAIIEGATARLRPILMTTITTGLGLLPLALGLGEGAQLQAPMAITIIGGQVTGTFLLLLAIPSIYEVLTKEKKEPQEESVSALQWDNELEWADHRTGRIQKPDGTRWFDRLSLGALIKNPAFMVTLRMLVVLLIAGIILYLLGISGENIFNVIQ